MTETVSLPELFGFRNIDQALSILCNQPIGLSVSDALKILQQGSLTDELSSRLLNLHSEGLVSLPEVLLTHLDPTYISPTTEP